MLFNVSLLCDFKLTKSINRLNKINNIQIKIGTIILKQEILNSKKQILDKMALMQTFKAIWSEDQKSNQFKLMMEGGLKGKTMVKSALT